MSPGRRGQLGFDHGQSGRRSAAGATACHGTTGTGDTERARPTIHHVQVAIPAGGEERARRFYGGLLGFEELPKPENLRRRGGVWFRTGNLDLHLGVDPAFRPATKAHVAFRVAGLDRLRDVLAAAGHAAVDDEPLAGYRRCYVDDPFGNRTELIEPA